MRAKDLARFAGYALLQSARFQNLITQQQLDRLPDLLRETEALP
jgi:hypothetical protein